MTNQPRRTKATRRSLAQQVVDLCDQILALAKKYPDVVGEWQQRSAFSGTIGRGGGAEDDVWDTVAVQLDAKARQIAVLVKAMDPPPPVVEFYGADPRPLIAKVPGGRVRMPEHERQWNLDFSIRMQPGRPRAEVEKDHAAFVAGIEQLDTDRARQTFTKPQWPGHIQEYRDPQGKWHVRFYSPPEMVDEWEQRFGTVKAWAEDRQQAELTKQRGRGGAGATEGRLYVENIDNFSLVRDVRSSMVAHLLKDGCMDAAENVVKMALEQILDVPFHRKDSPAELDDIYTANVIVNGRRHATAFMLKGPGIGTKEMDIKHCGSKGSQLVHLFDAPAKLFVVQFTGRIAETVVKDVEGKVTARRAQGKPAQFLIMEGQDTARVLYAYGKLKKKRRRRGRRNQSRNEFCRRKEVRVTGSKEKEHADRHDGTCPQ
jgi:hypothetical protein